jgi:hypothetical protein
MGDVSGICYNADLKVLICQVYGAAVRPGAGSITRHLRSSGHAIKGKLKINAVAALASLPLRSVEEVKRSCPPVHLQPVSPVPYVKVSGGWSCLRCRGNVLTTNEETIKKHVSSAHGQTAADHTADTPFWERCSLQTLFSMTEDIRYFRVTSNDLGPASSSPLAVTATTGAPERGPLPPGGDNDREEGSSNAPRQDAWDDGSDGDTGCDTEA